MITVTVYHNPLDLRQRTVREVADGATLRGLTVELASATEWPLPTIALVDGSPRMRQRWGAPLPAGAVVEFRSVLRGGGGGRNLFLNVATMGYYQFYQAGMSAVQGNYGEAFGNYSDPWGAGHYLAGSVGTPDVPSYLGGEAGSPTYSINYKSNRKRIGEAMPVLYGRHRLLPDLLTRSYVWYQGDDQYVAAVLCLGIGRFQVDTASLRFGEALFSELSGIQYQVLEPGDPLTLCHDHVSTSEAVTGQTIVGPAPSTSLQGAPTVAFSSFNDGTNHAVLASSSPIFAGVSVGNALIVTGTVNYNGTFTVEAVTSTSQVRVAFTGTPAAETPLAAVVTKSPSTPLITLPAALTFTASTKRLDSADGAGAFTGLNAGDSININNTASNNATFVVGSISDDHSYVVLQGTVADEVALNATVDFPGSGWSGWFEAAGARDEVQSLAVDLVAVRGLGTITDTGHISSRTITVTIQYQGLDASGVPAGIALTRSVVVTAAQQQAVRRTELWTNDTGHVRVRCRIRRTTAQSTSTKALDEIVWAGLKAYLPDVATYPGVTVLAVIAKASDQLTSQQSGQINVEATRLLPQWNGSAWSAPAPTRSIAWALADALRDAVYGAGLTDAEIDLPALLALDTIWSARGDQFDAVFDQTATIWEVLQRIARAGRAQPVLAGGVITFVRDGARTLRTAMFTPSQILPGSLAIDYKLPQDGDPDGTSVAWMDPAVWQQAHIDVIDGGGTPIEPQSIDLFGVTDQAQAQREAAYVDRVRKYQRKSIRWSTEMEGHLVNVGDLVALSHDVPAWGQSGDVIAVVGSVVTSSEPLTWTPSATHSVLLRRPDGSVTGPYVVAPVAGHPEQFTLATSLDFVPRTDLTNGDRTTFTFGPNATYTQDVVITAITPQDATTVEMQAVPYDPRIHAAGA